MGVLYCVWQKKIISKENINLKCFTKEAGLNLGVFFLFFVSIICLNNSLVIFPIHWDGTYFLRSAEGIFNHNFNVFILQESDELI